jgi:hypothetical protein
MSVKAVSKEQTPMKIFSKRNSGKIYFLYVGGIRSNAPRKIYVKSVMPRMPKAIARKL